MKLIVDTFEGLGELFRALSDEQMKILFDRRNYQALRQFLDSRVLGSYLTIGETRFRVIRFGKPEDNISFKKAASIVIQKKVVGDSAIQKFLSTDEQDISCPPDVLRRFHFFYVVEEDGKYLSKYLSYNHSSKCWKSNFVHDTHHIQQMNGFKISCNVLVFLREVK